MVELSLTNAAIAGYATYKFADAADIAINTRLAADAGGRHEDGPPRWNAREPANGEIYFTLTNNSNRSVSPSGGQYLPDAANPRAYTDMKGSSAQTGNPNGHLVRMKEGASVNTFNWDVYLFGAGATADATLVNLSALTADQDFSSPDGLAFQQVQRHLLDPDRRRRLHRRQQLHDAGCGARLGGRRRQRRPAPRPTAPTGHRHPVGKAARPTRSTLLVGPKAAKSPAWPKRRTARPSS